MKRAGLEWYSTEAESALRFFLSHITLADKRARYLDLISRPKSRRTFLDTLYHELELHLDPAKQVKTLSPKMLRLPGYCFYHGSEKFGEPVTHFNMVIASYDESFLFVSIDGKVGLHGPESYIDGRVFYIA